MITMKTIFLVLLIYSQNSIAKDITLKINGMVCSLCAQGISKHLKTIKQIKTFEVDLDKKSVFISTHEDQDILDVELNSAINNAGYSVVEIEKK